MILFLSGTGNSAYVAHRLSLLTDEELFTIPLLNPASVSFTGKNLLLVFPVYSWGVPPIVSDFISMLSETFVYELKKKGAGIVMICTCGDEVALAPEMLAKNLDKRGLNLDAAWSVIMPNNYVLLPGFDTDSRETEIYKLDKAPERITEIAALINKQEWQTDVVIGKMPVLKSKLIFPLFKKWGIFPSRWHWTQECIQCGKCAKVCPMDNIVMKGGHPKWGNNCISCVACYHNCPVHAVAYGNITNNKGQYVCPLK